MVSNRKNRTPSVIGGTLAVSLLIGSDSRNAVARRRSIVLGVRPGPIMVVAGYDGATPVSHSLAELMSREVV